MSSRMTGITSCIRTPALPKRFTHSGALAFAALLGLLLPSCGTQTKVSRPSGPRGIGGVIDPGKFVRKGTGYALLVGISDYAHADIPDLRFAHRDALA